MEKKCIETKDCIARSWPSVSLYSTFIVHCGKTDSYVLTLENFNPK